MSSSPTESLRENRTGMIQVKLNDSDELCWTDYNGLIALMGQQKSLAVDSPAGNEARLSVASTSISPGTRENVEKAYTIVKSEFPDETSPVKKRKSKTGKHRCDHQGCSYSTPSRTCLVAHARTHSGNQPFKCTHEGCPSAFSQASSLQRHLKSLVHSAGSQQSFQVKQEQPDAPDGNPRQSGPFQCTVSGCNFSGSHHQNLVYHLRVHTGEKPFKCTHPDCPMAFAQQVTLQRHSKVHSGKAKGTESWRSCQKRSESMLRMWALRRERGLTGRAKDAAGKSSRRRGRSDAKPAGGTRRRRKRQAKSVSPPPKIERHNSSSPDESMADDEPSGQDGTGPQYEVERVIGAAKIGRKSWYLIKWKGFEATQNSWELGSELTGAKEAVANFVAEFGKSATANPKLLSPEGETWEAVDTFGGNK